MIDELAQTYAHYVALRRELSLWVEQSIRRDGPDKNQGGEDEANFALAFFPHYLVSGDERIAVWFRALANDLKAWVRAECLHGYEPEAEAHHGTEPFLLFLPRYLGLFPDDREAAALLEDVAHHIGNWIEGVPAWYDWTRDVFLSYWIGTRTVGGAHGDRELAEHFRFLHIALAAWRVTGEARYRDWALRYGRKRAERLLAADGRMPVLWDLDGRGLQPEDLQTRAEWGMAANNHHIAGDPLAGIENLLASGAVYALGDLFLLEGDANRRIARSLRRPGRNWGGGAVTGCYGTLLMGTCEVQGAVVPLVEWAEGHLPEQILALLQPPVSGPGAVLFYNGGEERQALGWRMTGTADWQRIELAPGEVREYSLETEIGRGER